MESFATLTEFAVALAGFSGIAIAIGNRDGRIDELARWRNANLLVITLGAAFGSVTIPLFASFGLADAGLWRASSLGVVPISAACLLQPIVTARSLSDDSWARTSRPLWHFSMFGSGGATLGLIANAFGLFAEPFAGPLFAAVLWLLFLGTLQFFRILSGLPGRSDA